MNVLRESKRLRLSLVTVIAITAAPLFAQPPGMAPGTGTRDWDYCEIDPPELEAGMPKELSGSPSKRSRGDEIENVPHDPIAERRRR